MSIIRLQPDRGSRTALSKRTSLVWAAAAEAAALSPFKLHELTEPLCYYGYYGRNGQREVHSYARAARFGR